MNKTNIAILAVCILIVVVFSVMSLPFSRVSPPEEPEVVTPAEVENEQPLQPVGFETERRVERYYNIDLEYPRSSATFFPQIKTYVDKVKSDFVEMVPNTEEEAEAVGVSVDRAYGLKMDTQTYISSSTITYKLETYMFTGGAHGSTFVATFTYDKAGRYIPTEELLSTPDALNKVSAAARTYFYNKLGDSVQKDVVDLGTAPLHQNFNVWYIEGENVVFVFQQYQIGPYALGIQEFPLRLDLISSSGNSFD